MFYKRRGNLQGREKRVGIYRRGPEALAVAIERQDLGNVRKKVDGTDLMILRHSLQPRFNMPERQGDLLFSGVLGQYFFNGRFSETF